VYVCVGLGSGVGGGLGEGVGVGVGVGVVVGSGVGVGVGVAGVTGNALMNDVAITALSTCTAMEAQLYASASPT
jgi:hypothetical protein